MTDDVDEMKAMISISLVFATLEKKRLVKKLAGARKRKRELTGRCEGRKGYKLSENPKDQALVREAKRLRRKNPQSGKVRSYRKIAEELVALGYARENGAPYNAMTIRNITQ